MLIGLRRSLRSQLRLYRLHSYRGDGAAIAFSPDNKQLVSVGRDGVTLWDTATGKELYRLHSYGGDAAAIAFSPDSKQLASVGRYEVILWDTATGKQLHRLDGYRGDAAAIAFSPDSKQLALVGRYGVTLWDTATGKQLHRLYSYEGVGDAIAFSPDSKQLASVGRYGVVLWDTAAGKELFRLYSYGGVGDTIAFSPDSKQLASVEKYKVILWDTATGKELYRLNSYRDVGAAIAFSPDSKQLASVGRYEVTLWDTATGKKLYRLYSYGDVNAAIAFSPDSKQLASIERYKVTLWDTATGKELHRLHSYGDIAAAVAFSPDSKQLASVGTYEVTLWDTATGKELYRLDSYGGDAAAVAFSPDSKQLASVERYEVTLRDTATGKQLRRLDSYGGDAAAIAFSPDSKQFASVGRYKVTLWDTATGKQLHGLEGYRGDAAAIAFSPDSKQLASVGRYEVTLWDIATGKQLHRLDSYRGDAAIAFSPDSKQLASVGRYEVILWDTATGEQLHRFYSYRGDADAIAFSPDSKQLASVEVYEVTLWDTATGKELYRLDSYRGDAAAIAFSPDSKQLASVGRYEVILWDTATGKELYRLNSYGGDAAIAFSPDSKQLASVGRYEVTLWDTATGKELYRLDSYGGDAAAIAFSPDSKQLASVGRYEVILWDTATGKELYRLDSYRGDAAAIGLSSYSKQLVSASTDQTIFSDAATPTIVKSTLSGKSKVPYNLDETKDTVMAQSLYDAGKPMAQVQDVLSHIGGGQHTVNVQVNWQLREYVRDGLDETQDLATVLTITGEQDKAYACSCENYVKFAWGKNISIPEFFRAFTASEFISSAKALSPGVNQFFFQSNQLTVFADVESSILLNGSEKLTFRVTAGRDCLVGICQCILWLAAVCRPPEQGSVYASSAAFEKVGLDRFVIRTEPLRPLPSPGSSTTVGCCWLNMFDGGYVLAQGFPVPTRNSGQGIESPFDMMIEQAMTYHTISRRGSIILKGSHTALVPILVDGIGALDQSEEVQWHLIGRKPKLVQVDLTDVSKRAEGYYLTDATFTTEDPDLYWEAIDKTCLKILPVKSIQELSGKRMFVGHFLKAQVLLGTNEAGYENVEASDAKLVRGNVVDFGQAINIAMGTNFGTAGIFNMTGSTTVRRTKYDNTPKQVPAFIGDLLRNRRSRPHIFYDVEKKTAWMIPEACVILYLMHRWASLQEPPSVTDDQQEAPEEPSSQQSDRYRPSDSRQEDPLELQESSLLKYMPFIRASCDGGKKAADAIWTKFSQLQELPKYIRSVEKPEKPVYVANIVVRMYLTIDSLIEHQKSKKPGFLTRQRDRPYMWGYELAEVAELNKAYAKGVRINKARSGGWYDLTEPKSEIAILFGRKFGDLIKYERGQTLCHCWKRVPIGNYFLSAESEALKYLLRRLDQRGLPKLFLSNKHSGSNKCEHQKCENKAWPCCNMALQLKSTAPRVVIEGEEGEAVVIGKAVTKLKKPADNGFQVSKRRRSEGSVEPQGVSGRLSEASELPNGDPSEEIFQGGAECNAAAEPEECDSSDDAEYLSCDE